MDPNRTIRPTHTVLLSCGGDELANAYRHLAIRSNPQVDVVVLSTGENATTEGQVRQLAAQGPLDLCLLVLNNIRYDVGNGTAASLRGVHCPGARTGGKTYTNVVAVYGNPQNNPVYHQRLLDTGALGVLELPHPLKPIQELFQKALG